MSAQDEDCEAFLREMVIIGEDVGDAVVCGPVDHRSRRGSSLALPAEHMLRSPRESPRLGASQAADNDHRVAAAL